MFSQLLLFPENLAQLHFTNLTNLTNYGNDSIGPHPLTKSEDQNVIQKPEYSFKQNYRIPQLTNII